MTTILGHLLAAYVILVAPWLGCYCYRKALKRIQSGESNVKLRLYRALGIEQVISSAVILVFWLLGRIPASSLGFRAPGLRSIAILLAIGAVLVWSGLKLRAKAEKIREKLHDGIGLLLPDTAKERASFAAISVGAGISEELAYRAFLLYYLGHYLPDLNIVAKLLLSSLAFGLGHLYQGRKGVTSTGVVGFVLGSLFVASGSLLVPMVLHAITDLRMLLILPEQKPRAIGAEAAAQKFRVDAMFM